MHSTLAVVLSRVFACHHRTSSPTKTAVGRAPSISHDRRSTVMIFLRKGFGACRGSMIWLRCWGYRQERLGLVFLSEMFFFDLEKRPLAAVGTVAGALVMRSA